MFVYEDHSRLGNPKMTAIANGRRSTAGSGPFTAGQAKVGEARQIKKPARTPYGRYPVCVAKGGGGGGPELFVSYDRARGGRRGLSVGNIPRSAVGAGRRGSFFVLILRGCVMETMPGLAEGPSAGQHSTLTK